MRALIRSVLPSEAPVDGPQLASAVLSCALDPADQQRLAFTLANGSSGDPSIDVGHGCLGPCASSLEVISDYTIYCRLS